MKQFKPDMRLSDLIQVCDKCLCSSCWQGVFMCQEAQHAGTVYKTRGELIELNLENPCYMKTDAELWVEVGDE